MADRVVMNNVFDNEEIAVAVIVRCNWKTNQLHLIYYTNKTLVVMNVIKWEEWYFSFDQILNIYTDFLLCQI